MFLKKPSSVVTEDEGGTLHPKAVAAVVSWSESANAVIDVDEETSPGDGETHGDVESQVRMRVQPELKLPTIGAKGLEWTQSDAVHPFWFIQRPDKDDTIANAQIVQQEWSHVAACAFKAVTSAAATVPPTTNTFSLSVPFIINTQAIEAGKEVILKWRPTDSQRKTGAADTNAFDQILQQDKKQRRAKAKGAGA